MVDTFLLVEKQAIKNDKNNIAYLYKHKKTGLEIFHIKNESKEYCATFMFSTPPEDNTGCAHIIEHTVLCGSKLYPVKDPFMIAIQGSPNTYLNAITFSERTVYPIASPLKKDFDSLFSIYADAVFHPLLRKESFQQEGVRCTPKGFDGVVFNEMSGAYVTEDDYVMKYSIENLFRDGCNSYDSGGMPENIADLTYDEYVERYKKWYSPSNCRLFLYGDLDTDEYLKKLEDEYLSDYNEQISTKENIIPNTDIYKCKITKPEYKCVKIPTKEAKSVLVNWATCYSSDPVDVLTASTIVDMLLGNPGAPLYRAITDSKIGLDLSNASGIDPEFYQIPFSIGVTGAKRSPKEIEEFIIKTLSEMVEKGLDKEVVECALKRQEFSLLEPPSGFPEGLRNMRRVARSWMHNGSPFDAFDSNDILDELKKRVAKGNYFENWIKKYLINNPQRLLLSVEPSQEIDDKRNNILQKKIHPEDLSSFKKFLNCSDKKEDIEKIVHIHRDDLPTEIEDYPVKVADKISYQELNTNGIVYYKISFDLIDLTKDELILIPLLTRLLQMTGTKKHNYADFSLSLRKNTGSWYVGSNSDSDINGKPNCFFVLNSKMLETDAETAISLFKELLIEADVDNIERIEAARMDILVDFKSNYLDSGISFAALRAASPMSPVLSAQELFLGTQAWIELEKNEPEQLRTKLVSLYHKLANRERMTFHIGCSPKFSQKIINLTNDFLSCFNSTKIEKSSFFDDSIKTGVNELLHYEGGPNHNALVIKLDKSDSKTFSRRAVLSDILGMGRLWDSIRSQGGAYGVAVQVNSMENVIFFSSYRDPRQEATFIDYIAALKKVIEEGIDAKEIEKSILKLVGSELKPRSPQEKTNIGYRRFISGLTYDIYLQRREAILSLKPQDLIKEAKNILNCYNEGKYNRVSISSNKLDDWKITNLPF